MNPPSRISKALQIDLRTGRVQQADKQRALGIFDSSLPAGISMASSPQISSLLQLRAAGLGTGFGAASSLGGFHREIIGQEGYRKIADWTHSLAKTPTDQWLDSFKGGPFHRWMNHHPVDFAKAWLTDKAGELRIADYLRHLSLDVITTNGLPLLPETVHVLLRNFGVPVETIVRWMHLNIFDVAFGSLSVVDGASTFVLAVTGHLRWGGAQTFLFTFGQGAFEVGIGIATDNPLLVAGGAMHIGSGAVSLWEHWHAPNQELLAETASLLLPAALGATMSTALRLGFVWQETSGIQKLQVSCESTAISVGACLLSSLSSLIVPPASVGYTLGKLAWRIADEDSEFWNSNNISSPLTLELALNQILKSGNESSIQRLKEFLSERQRCAVVLAPTYLESPDLLLRPDQGTEHVLAKDAAWNTHVASKENLFEVTASDAKALSAPEDAATAFAPEWFGKEKL